MDQEGRQVGASVQQLLNSRHGRDLARCTAPFDVMGNTVMGQRRWLTGRCLRFVAALETFEQHHMMRAGAFVIPPIS
jgi:hypothetical protein